MLLRYLDILSFFHVSGKKEAIYALLYWGTLAETMQYDPLDYEEQLAPKILKYIQHIFKIQMIPISQGRWYRMIRCRLQLRNHLEHFGRFLIYTEETDAIFFRVNPRSVLGETALYLREFDLTADFGIMDVLRISIGGSLTEDLHREMI